MRTGILCSTDRWSRADASFFALLDRDSDGKVTVDDLKECLRKHNLPGDYAHKFIERARGGRWWASSISFQEFKSLVDDNESKMLRAFSLLETDAKGNLDLNKLKGMPLASGSELIFPLPLAACIYFQAASDIRADKV